MRRQPSSLLMALGAVVFLLVRARLAQATEPLEAQSSSVPRRLTLGEAIRAAWAVDPTVAQARIARDRAQLAVLRSQLDRVSVRLDGSVQELFNKSNIGGPKLTVCSFGSISLQLSAAECTSMGGTASAAADSSPSSGQGLFNLSANINVPIFSGLRVESTVKRNQLLQQSATVSERQVRRELALATARAYWSVRRLALLVEAQRDAVARLEEAERATGARVLAGLAPALDRNRARSRKLQQVATWVDLVGQQREAQVQLAVALQIEEDIELVDNPQLDGDLGCSSRTLDRTGWRQRPELLRAKLQLDVQEQTIRIARSGYLPQLNGFFLFQYGNNALSIGSGARSTSAAANPFSGLAGNLSIGASLSMNFFDMLSTWTAVKDARFEQARLFAETKRVERGLDNEIRTACVHVERLASRRVALMEVRDVAKDNLGSLEKRYKNGDALLIELLDSQLELTNAELQLVDLGAQLQLARLELLGAQSGSPLILEGDAK